MSDDLYIIKLLQCENYEICFILIYTLSVLYRDSYIFIERLTDLVLKIIGKVIKFDMWFAYMVEGAQAKSV